MTFVTKIYKKCKTNQVAKILTKNSVSAKKICKNYLFSKVCLYILTGIQISIIFSDLFILLPALFFQDDWRPDRLPPWSLFRFVAITQCISNSRPDLKTHATAPLITPLKWSVLQGIKWNPQKLFSISVVEKVRNRSLHHLCAFWKIQN